MQELRHIKNRMERRRRFISLSGLRGIAAGIWALIGLWFAYDWIHEYYVHYNETGYSGRSFQRIEFSLMILAGAILATALTSAFYFT